MKLNAMLEQTGINRREFLKYAAVAGSLSFLNTQKAEAFSSNAKGRIVIIGAGAAGLSLAARLRKWLKKPDLTLIDPADRQFYQPGFTLIASGVYQPGEVWKKQEDCIPKDIRWIKEAVVAVDPVANRVTTSGNQKIDYDFLVIAPGIQIHWDWIEGFDYSKLGQGNAHSIYDFQGAQKTWQAMQEFSRTGGKGVYTDTYTKHKCGGAPKKICLLTEHYTRKQQTRETVDLHFYTASKQLYDVPYFTPRLLDIYAERHIPINLTTRVKGIDTAAKQVYLEKTETVGDQKIITPIKEDYDFLHFTPPMSAPDFVRQAGLDSADGTVPEQSWVAVDKETLIHKNYPNIIALGDCAGIPTSKTSAATRMQVPIAGKNLIALMEGKEPTERYDGYAACPIVTDYGHVLMCEFDYSKERKSSFPFSWMNASQELRLAWLVKVYMLKPLYFYGMLKGKA
ncbi:FAD/NAD(P)-binding oxidoreductase [Parabacteroides sp. PF5-6]|uniref:NAD(P)/FAD-dependent oxidoreductase n=1 Tax=Parabacteroides sp. PF5-6 TaxID=1742403 RepID=UPI0032167C69